MYCTILAKIAIAFRQVAGLFIAEERGTHELKGVPEPVTLFRLIRASGGGRRLGQRHLTPLVGRDEEIAILMRRWERARCTRPVTTTAPGSASACARGDVWHVTENLARCTRH